MVGGELARGRNLQLLFNWWNRLLFILASGSSNGVRLIKESLYAYYLGKLRLSQPIRFLKNSNLFTSVFLHLEQGKCIYLEELSFNGLLYISFSPEWLLRVCVDNHSNSQIATNNGN